MASFNLAPIFNAAQLFSANGMPLNAGQIFTYAAGTSTPTATYTTNLGTVSSPNPIVLGADGRVTNEIWIPSGYSYKFVLMDALNNTIATYDNLFGINDPQITFSEWVASGYVPVFISANSFSVTGNALNIFQVNRRVQITVNLGIIYGTITSSVFSAGITTCIVSLDSGLIDNTISSINVSLLGANNLSLPATIATTAQAGYKNKLIGGDFTTNPWQRGTSFPAIINTTYSADRWYFQKTGTAVQTISKVADAPTVAQAGIYTAYCLGSAMTTAQTSLAISDYNVISQRVEGFNIASLGFGQAGTRNVTLSFWVKGAKTGIHSVALRNGGANRSYIAEYTINALNTWEYKTIAMPVDTAGTWLYDTGTGIEVMFALAAGTSFQTTANSWQAGNFLASNNQVNELDSVNNLFKIALVQFELGSIATSFEVRSGGFEEVLCFKYYEKLIHASGNILMMNFTSAGQTASTLLGRGAKRTTPTIIINSSTVVNGTLGGYASTNTSYGVAINSAAAGLAYATAFDIGISAEL